MNDVSLVVGYSTLVFFIVLITSLGSPALLSSSSVDASDVKPPNCQIGGWSAPIDIGKCVFGSLAVFFTLMQVNASVRIFGTIVLTPLLLGFLWIILKLIRG